MKCYKCHREAYFYDPNLCDLHYVLKATACYEDHFSKEESAKRRIAWIKQLWEESRKPKPKDWKEMLNALLQVPPGSDV